MVYQSEVKLVRGIGAVLISTFVIFTAGCAPHTDLRAPAGSAAEGNQASDNANPVSLNCQDRSGEVHADAGVAQTAANQRGGSPQAVSGTNLSPMDQECHRPGNGEPTPEGYLADVQCSITPDDANLAEVARFLLHCDFGYRSQGKGFVPREIAAGGLLRVVWSNVPQAIVSKTSSRGLPIEDWADISSEQVNCGERENGAKFECKIRSGGIISPVEFGVQVSAKITEEGKPDREIVERTGYKRFVFDDPVIIRNLASREVTTPASINNPAKTISVSPRYKHIETCTNHGGDIGLVSIREFWGPVGEVFQDPYITEVILQRYNKATISWSEDTNVAVYDLAAQQSNPHPAGYVEIRPSGVRCSMDGRGNVTIVWWGGSKFYRHYFENRTGRLSQMSLISDRYATQAELENAVNLKGNDAGQGMFVFRGIDGIFAHAYDRESWGRVENLYEANPSANLDSRYADIWVDQAGNTTLVADVPLELKTGARVQRIWSYGRANEIWLKTVDTPQAANGWFERPILLGDAEGHLAFFSVEQSGPARFYMAPAFAAWNISRHVEVPGAERMRLFGNEFRPENVRSNWRGQGLMVYSTSASGIYAREFSLSDGQFGTPILLANLTSPERFYLAFNDAGDAVVGFYGGSSHEYSGEYYVTSHAAGGKWVAPIVLPQFNDGGNSLRTPGQTLNSMFVDQEGNLSMIAPSRSAIPAGQTTVAVDTELRLITGHR